MSSSGVGTAGTAGVNTGTGTVSAEAISDGKEKIADSGIGSNTKVEKGRTAA